MRFRGPAPDPEDDLPPYLRIGRIWKTATTGDDVSDADFWKITGATRRAQADQVEQLLQHLPSHLSEDTQADLIRMLLDLQNFLVEDAFRCERRAEEYAT